MRRRTGTRAVAEILEGLRTAGEDVGNGALHSLRPARPALDRAQIVCSIELAPVVQRFLRASSPRKPKRRRSRCEPNRERIAQA